MSRYSDHNPKIQQRLAFVATKRMKIETRKQKDTTVPSRIAEGYRASERGYKANVGWHTRVRPSEGHQPVIQTAGQGRDRTTQRTRGYCGRHFNNSFYIYLPRSALGLAS